MQVRAKMRCTSVFPYYGNPANGEHVRLTAVYSSDPADPNFSYSQATPQANCELVITNPDAQGQFVPNEDYLVTFERA